MMASLYLPTYLLTDSLKARDASASINPKIHLSIQYNSSPYSNTVLHLSYAIWIHYKYNQHCSISHQCNASHFQLTARLANGWHGANALRLAVMEARREQGRSSNNQRTEEMSAQIWRKQTGAILQDAQVLSDDLAFWFSPPKHQTPLPRDMVKDHNFPLLFAHFPNLCIGQFLQHGKNGFFMSYFF